MSRQPVPGCELYLNSLTSNVYNSLVISKERNSGGHEMNRTFISIFACLVLICLSFPDRSLSQEPKSAYSIMLENIIKLVRSKDQSLGDTQTISKMFKELRFAYTETPQYNPYGGLKADTAPAMWEAVRGKNYSRAIELAEYILKDNFLDIDAHMVASTSYRDTGNQVEADYHQIIAQGLILSLLSGGFGDSAESAIEVISVDEEHAILNIAGLNMKSQAELNVNGHELDKLTVVDSASGQTFAMYFCIDKPFAWLQNSLKKPKGL